MGMNALHVETFVILKAGSVIALFIILVVALSYYGVQCAREFEDQLTTNIAGVLRQ